MYWKNVLENVLEKCIGKLQILAVFSNTRSFLKKVYLENFLGKSQILAVFANTRSFDLEKFSKKI